MAVPALDEFPEIGPWAWCGIARDPLQGPRPAPEGLHARPQVLIVGRMSLLRKILLALGVVLIGIQFVPAEITNPPVTADVGAPPEVAAVLRRACYDCHSNETVWPWYSKVAPFKFLLAHDVEEARAALNFSTWDAYSAEQAAHKLEEVWEEVEEGEMPLWFYTPLHPEAKLSDSDRELLHGWSKMAASETEALEAEAAGD